MSAASVGVASSTARASAVDQYIVVLRAGADARKVARAHERKYGFTAEFVYQYALRGYSGLIDADDIQAIEQEPDVLFVDLDADDPFPPPAPPVEQPPQTPSFTIGRIDADESSTVSGDGKGAVKVNVAVLDSGVQPDHPELNVVNGWNCIGSNRNDWADPLYHGTAVAGFVAALDNKIGEVGIAPGARISAVRVLDETGFGTDSQVICGMDWVASTRLDGNRDNDIAIANMSLGGGETDDNACGSILHDAFHHAICGLVARGVTVVAAAGNETFDFEHLAPATYSEVLTATAMADRDAMPGGLGGAFTCDPTEFDDTPATFSNWATQPSDQAHVVAAPGVCTAGLSINSGYGAGSGTSFSTPIVAGVVALCIASGPCAGMTPAQIVSKIVADAQAYNLANPSYGFQGDPLRPSGSRYYGYLINAGIY